jgi:hypothetical protein
MGVTINSWMTDSSGWQTMNRMQAATFSGALVFRLTRSEPPVLDRKVACLGE